MHMLHNKRIIQEMISYAQIKSTDLVLDLGAGKGAFTQLLGDQAGKVLAVENDAEFVKYLLDKFGGHPTIKVINQDILKLKLPMIPYCIVASIPFSITTPILNRLLVPSGHLLQKAVILVEKGAAIDFTAFPITKPKILIWKTWFDLKLIKSVSRDHFAPPPRVDSAILSIRRKAMPKVDRKHFRHFVAFAKYGLTYPKDTVADVLSGIFTNHQLKQILRRIQADRFSPVCSLKEDQWADVFLTMIQYVEPYRWPRIRF